MNALIIVDVQNDFCPGGALAVNGGDKIVPGINRIRDRFDVVVTTQDRHPRDHGSFASNHEGKNPFEMGELGGRPQVLWPDHCVEGSDGAAFHRDLLPGDKNFTKGGNREADSYSGFFDNDGRSTGLGDYLRGKGINEVYVCGLATDYCVKFTALDAVREGFAVHVVKDLCRGVDIIPGDSEKALDEMEKAGINVVTEADTAI